MLFNLSQQKIEDIPHKKDYDLWKSRLTDDQYVQIMSKLEEELNTRNVFVSSHIPGKEWDYPLYYIYEACNKHFEHAAYFYGLLLWEAVIRHPAKWYFKPKDEDDAFKGTVYFRHNEDRI